MSSDYTKLTEQLRILVRDVELDEYWSSDGYLLRWLQYTNCDVQKSAMALRESILWKAKHKVGSILEEDYGDLSKRFPVDMTQIDKHGRLIVKVRCQDFDCKDLNVERSEWKRFIRFSLWVQQTVEMRLKEQFYNTGQRACQGIAILDLSNMSHLVKEAGITRIYTMLWLVKKIVSDVETNFPRGIDVTYIINAPKIFSLFHSAMKTLFCSQTAKSLKIYGVESHFDWKTELLLKQEDTNIFS